MGRPKTKHIPPPMEDLNTAVAKDLIRAQHICDMVWANQSSDVAYNERVRRCIAAAKAQGCNDDDIKAVEFG